MKKISKIFSFLCSLSLASSFSRTAENISAKEIAGDLDKDGKITVSDAFIFRNHLLGNDDLPEISSADLDNDGTVNIADYVTLLAYLTGDLQPVYPESPFIESNISNVIHSLPSKGESQLVIFYVDFPDCKFSEKMTAEEIDKLAFGKADENSYIYPFESMTAFYERSSKGAMKLGGKTFSYTAKESISAYSNDKERLTIECYEAFKDIEDFSRFDSDNDGVIDATLICVPEAVNGADDDYWWPSAGPLDTDFYRVDGVSVGFVITGNSTPSDPFSFNNGYLHEMGHCMGIPDYYLYYSNDAEGLKGTAGTELMDNDLYADFCSFSKLMLGWYREDQVSVFDYSKGTQTFTLCDAQNDDGNCVIIPCGELDDGYFSEYFIIEYSTTEKNNSYYNNNLSWWWQKPIDNGVRIHHIKADITFNGWWTYFKYENGSEETGYDDDGIRLIRLVNDGGGVFRKGDVIDSGSVSGFGWYDIYENETIDPGVRISVDDIQDGDYIITVSVK